MTREEREQAIAYLETSFVAESNTDGGWSTHHNNVIRTAIKALEREPIPEQWQELKETIIELRDNDGTGTQQEVCKFLANYMEVLEKQMKEDKEEQLKKLEAELDYAKFRCALPIIQHMMGSEAKNDC